MRREDRFEDQFSSQGGGGEGELEALLGCLHRSRNDVLVDGAVDGQIGVHDRLVGELNIEARDRRSVGPHGFLANRVPDRLRSISIHGYPTVPDGGELRDHVRHRLERDPIDVVHSSPNGVAHEGDRRIEPARKKHIEGCRLQCQAQDRLSPIGLPIGQRVGGDCG